MTNDEKRRIFKAFFLFGILGTKDEIYFLTENDFSPEFQEAKDAGLKAAKKRKALCLNELATQADFYALNWCNEYKNGGGCFTSYGDNLKDTIAAIDAGVDEIGGL